MLKQEEKKFSRNTQTRSYAGSRGRRGKVHVNVGAAELTATREEHETIAFAT